MELKDCRIKAIYHYLTESVDNHDIKVLVELLNDYINNSNFVDFEKDDSRVQHITDELYKLLGF